MDVLILKWQDAMVIAGYAFTKAEQDAGWPDRMNARQLAALQRPRYFTPVKRMMEPALSDPQDLAHIEQNRTNLVLHKILELEFTAGRGPDTPELFAAWLAAQGEAPSVHIQAWFDAVGVASDKPVVPDAPENESRAERNDRWLVHFETEQKREPKGALQRTASYFKANRSTVGKCIQNAKALRAEKYRAGIKSVPGKSKKPASQYDQLIVRDGKRPTR